MTDKQTISRADRQKTANDYAMTIVQSDYTVHTICTGKDGEYQVSFREPTLKATSAFVTAAGAHFFLVFNKYCLFTT